MTQTKLLVIWLILLIILALRYYFYSTSQPQYKTGETVSYTATIFTEPTIKANRQEFVLNSITIVAPGFPRYHYADRLKISGKVVERKTSAINSWVPIKNRQELAIYFPKIEGENSDRLDTLGVISKIRQRVITVMRSSLPSTEGSLISGILLGSKEGFSQSFLNALKNTGTLHVVAASGMNVSIFASFIMGFFMRMLPRRIVAILVLLSIVFYTLLASLEPSIVRAAIMGGLVFTGSILNRALIAGWGLLLAGYSMLFFDPKLVFDIGFQLSFAATGGLLFLKPLLEKSWYWFGAVGKIAAIGDSSTTTIVAQIATLPILLSSFGSFSLLSIPVNTLVLWTAQPIMVLGITAALLSFLPGVAFLPLLAALPLLSFFEMVVNFFNKPQFLIDIKIPFLVALGYYCLLIGLYYWLSAMLKEQSPKSAAQNLKNLRTKSVPF